MNKYSLFFILFGILFLNLPIFADSWDDFSNIDRMWDGQKSITNQEFEQVMEKLEEKGKQKEEKQTRKKRKKMFGSGTTLHEELNPDGKIPELQTFEDTKEELVVNIPVNVYLDAKQLEKGYYKVTGEKKDGKVFLNFYQSQFFKGKIEAIATDSDFEQDKIDFVELLPYNESFVKLIYGSLDFNAYVFLPYSE